MFAKKLTQSELNDALLSAAEKGETDKVKELISKGADVNANDTNGWITLHRASWYGHTKTVNFLIENGADINVKNKYNGYTALHYASCNNHIKIAKIFIENCADISAKTNHGWIAEDIARNVGYIKLAEMLKNASERQKALKETEEQLAYQKRIHDALRRKDPLTMSDRDFLNMLESEADKK